MQALPCLRYIIGFSFITKRLLRPSKGKLSFMWCGRFHVYYILHFSFMTSRLLRPSTGQLSSRWCRYCRVYYILYVSPSGGYLDHLRASFPPSDTGTVMFTMYRTFSFITRRLLRPSTGQLSSMWCRRFFVYCLLHVYNYILYVFSVWQGGYLDNLRANFPPSDAGNIMLLFNKRFSFITRRLLRPSTGQLSS